MTGQSNIFKINLKPSPICDTRVSPEEDAFKLVVDNNGVNTLAKNVKRYPRPADFSPSSTNMAT